MSFLGLEGYHAFITGAAGGIGSEAVREFLSKYVEEGNPITLPQTSPADPANQQTKAAK